MSRSGRLTEFKLKAVGLAHLIPQRRKDRLRAQKKLAKKLGEKPRHG